MRGCLVRVEWNVGTGRAESDNGLMVVDVQCPLYCPRQFRAILLSMTSEESS